MCKDPQSSYIRWLIGFTFLILAVCASWNWFVDPYDMFGNTRIKDINQTKPVAESRERISKPYRILDVQPRTLILGNSRPELGLDPSYHCWPEAMKPVYNMAMLGTGLYENYRNLQHAVHQGRIEHLFLGLDFLFFVQQNDLTDPILWDPPKRDLEHLQIFAHGNVNQYFEWHRLLNGLKALFSLQATIDSIRTVLSQGDPNAPTINPDGHNPGRQFLSGIAIEGQKVFFTQKNLEVAELLAQQRVLFQDGLRWSKPLETLRRILVLAISNDIQVTLFINPRHADFLNLIALSGKWSMKEEWKRVLTEIAEEHQVEVWDFHDFDEFSIPPAPSEAGKALVGFWEPGHYRSELGNAMINRMVGGEDCEILKVGTLLLPDEIEVHLEKLRQRQHKYVKVHNTEFISLKDLYARFVQ